MYTHQIKIIKYINLINYYLILHQTTFPRKHSQLETDSNNTLQERKNPS